MTVPPTRSAAPSPRGPSYPRDSLERTQLEHELTRALEAARTLQERLELAGLLGHVPAIRRIRDDLAGRLVELATADFYREPTQEAFAQIVGDKGDKALVDGPPCQAFSELPIA